MSSPFFTIITPTYNRAHLLSALIEQVLAQTFTDFEYIIIDDGSTDNTEEVVRQFNDNRIIYHKKENEERGVARNTGVKLSKGKYINFFDSDDIMLSNHLEIAYQFIGEQAPDVFSCAYETVDEAGNVVFTFRLDGKNANRLILRKNLLSINGLFFKHHIPKEYPFIEDRRFKVGEDWLIWIKISLKYQIRFLNKITSQIVQHDARTMNMPSSSILYDSYDLFHQHLENTLSSKLVRNIKFEQLSLIAISLADEGEKWKATKTLLRCVGLRPINIMTKRFIVMLMFILGLK